MKTELLKSIKKHVVNMPGWRTDRKIVVIESDDWGMIRMASKEVYDWFLKKGYRVDECPLNRTDTIESNEDLEQLFEVLHSVSDIYGKPAVMTANNIVGNPDFEKIEQSNFNEYFFEPFTQTLQRYSGRDRVWDLYQEGIDHRLFYPQFHGREHLNVNRWMAALKSGNRVAHDAFRKGMFTVHEKGKMSCYRDNLDAFGMRYAKEWVTMEEVITSGLELFKKLWGYNSLSFIAPCYIWPAEIEQVLAENGVRYIQGTHVQRVPVNSTNKIKRVYHFQSQKNKLGQRYLVQNVFFEPALHPAEDVVSKALKEIEAAFRYKKPAIICSHRCNFVGSINAENRDLNLMQLKLLLKKITQKWPGVEFMTSSDLGRCFENKTIGLPQNWY